MTSLFITALLLGAIGSFHCIGMCGPIAMSIPVVQHDHGSKFVSSLLYNAGRVLTYASLGLLFGLIGQSFAIFGYQQWLSIILGILLMLLIVLPKRTGVEKNWIAVGFQKIRTALGSLFLRKNYRSVFFIGLLNGLLPCGLVYMAMAGAISTASVWKSCLFMAAFGLGTLPMMWSIGFFGSYINLRARNGIRKLYPYLMALMAAILILRGMGLDIPYISPSMKDKAVVGTMAVDCHD